MTGDEYYRQRDMFFQGAWGHHYASGAERESAEATVSQAWRGGWWFGSPVWARLVTQAAVAAMQGEDG